MFKLSFSSINFIFPVLVALFLLLLLLLLHRISGSDALSHKTCGLSENSWKSFLCKGSNQWWSYTWKELQNICLSLSYKLNIYAIKFVLVSSGCLGSSKCPQSFQRLEGNREKFKSKENGIKLKDFTFIIFFKNIIQFKHISRALSGINHSLGT